jgi:hypothetical protein
MTVNTNPLSYNAYIQQIGLLVPVGTTLAAGLYTLNDANLQAAVPMILSYAENRIQRDLDMLPAQTSNTYTLTAGTPSIPLPVDDFVIVQRISIQQLTGAQVISTTPLLQVSAEFIQNVYGGLSTPGQPQYYAMTGDTWGNGGDVNNTIALGPTPNYAYTIRVHGLIRIPSLYKYAVSGIADTQYTYISSYYQDLLMMASMIYVSGPYQKNFSATADDSPSSLSYEKAYQALRIGAIDEENRKKGHGSGWSAYSTPTSATPTR